MSAGAHEACELYSFYFRFTLFCCKLFMCFAVSDASHEFGRHQVRNLLRRGPKDSWGACIKSVCVVAIVYMRVMLSKIMLVFEWGCGNFFNRYRPVVGNISGNNAMFDSYVHLHENYVRPKSNFRFTIVAVWWIVCCLLFYMILFSDELGFEWTYVCIDADLVHFDISA